MLCELMFMWGGLVVRCVMCPGRDDGERRARYTTAKATTGAAKDETRGTPNVWGDRHRHGGGASNGGRATVERASPFVCEVEPLRSEMLNV